MYAASGNSLSFAANNNNFTSIYVAPSGSVGIGNTSPIAPLSVVGNANITGTLLSLGLSGGGFATGFVDRTSSSGYCLLPNNLLLQWGTVSAGTAGVVVSYPKTFTGGVMGVIATPYTATYATTLGTAVANQTNTQFEVRTGATRTIYWLAVGFVA